MQTFCILVLGVGILPPWPAIGLASTLYLGVNPEGHLIVPNGSGGTVIPGRTDVGLYHTPSGIDGIAEGFFGEGWGAAGSTVSGWASTENGIYNLTVESHASTYSTFTSVTRLEAAGLRVTHHYSSSPVPSAFEALIILENSTSFPLADVRYTRVVDWDLPTHEEFITLYGWPSALIFSSNDGFQVPDPLIHPIAIGNLDVGLVNQNFQNAGPADHGTVFTFGFGSLAGFQSRRFSMFYGAAESEAAARAALNLLGAEVFSLAYHPDASAAFFLAFSGVGGVPFQDPAPIPEPGTGLLIILGLALGIYRKGLLMKLR